LQIVNVACGGTLVRHLEDHPETPAGSGGVSHRIAIERSSRLAARHPDLVMVNSYHHQAVERPGEGVRVVARAPDGVVEAIEVDGAERLVAVQWHPEALIERPEQLSLFRWLTAAARATPAPTR
jgi:putative glutamine amidotransferase